MTSKTNWVRNLTALLVVTLVAISAYPGLIESYLFSLLGFITLLPALGLWGLLVAFVGLRDLMQARAFHQAFGFQAACVAAVRFSLVVTGIPMQAGFAFARPAFERFLEHADFAPAKAYRGEALSRWFGIYHVDRWAVDARGGIYFRVCTGEDGFDVMSYGFVLEPNRQASPFGGAKYRIERLAGDWSTFAASDDHP